MEMEGRNTQHMIKSSILLSKLFIFGDMILLARNLFSTLITKPCDFLMVNTNLVQNMPNGQIFFNTFSFTVCYNAGLLNQVADTLSRRHTLVSSLKLLV